MSLFNHAEFDHHEQVQFCEDAGSGLKAIIAIHDTTLGPAVGGCRMFDYADEAAALSDVLRLSRGMTYKSALAGLPMGGGKSVIIGDPGVDKSNDLLLSMASFIDSLSGRYVCAEDSGTSVADMRLMNTLTEHVSGVNEGGKYGGDPSPTTALGVFMAIQIAVAHRLGAHSLMGKSVAVQGLGNVGYHLAQYLCEAGVKVYGADVNAANLYRAVNELGVIAVAPEDILAFPADILAPCAMGAVINDQTVGRINAGIIAGAANNQLARPAHAEELRERGILYCPDFLINAGGIVDVHCQRMGETAAQLRTRLRGIEQHLSKVLTRSDRDALDTHFIAERLSEEILHSARLAKAG